MWLSELELAGSSKPDALQMVGNIVSVRMLAAAICKLSVGKWIDEQRPAKPFVIGGTLVALTMSVGCLVWWHIVPHRHLGSQCYQSGLHRRNPSQIEIEF
jgi:MFS-type transporter involved in bile tolerance (Atg22 family)